MKPSKLIGGTIAFLGFEAVAILMIVYVLQQEYMQMTGITLSGVWVIGHGFMLSHWRSVKGFFYD